MGQYVLLLRRDVAGAPMTEADGAAMMTKFIDWSRGLRDRGILRGTERLKASDAGRTVRKRAGALVVDGPYAEAKEVVVGLYVIDAADIDEAARLAMGCPILGIGGTIEVREADAFAVRPHGDTRPSA